MAMTCEHCNWKGEASVLTFSFHANKLCALFVDEVSKQLQDGS